MATTKKAENGKPACEFRGCKEPAVAHGLCGGHYRQQLRHPGEPLQPLRPTDVERLGTMRVSSACFARLERKGDSATRAAIEVLEAWNREQERKEAEKKEARG